MQIWLDIGKGSLKDGAEKLFRRYHGQEAFAAVDDLDDTEKLVQENFF
jgi:hypothetical protein